MLWEHDVALIVMVANFVERGKVKMWVCLAFMGIIIVKLMLILSEKVIRISAMSECNGEAIKVFYLSISMLFSLIYLEKMRRLLEGYGRRQNGDQ